MPDAPTKEATPAKGKSPATQTAPKKAAPATEEPEDETPAKPPAAAEEPEDEAPPATR